MAKLAEGLPVLLSIVKSVDISTLLSFRLLKKSIYELIWRYELSIVQRAKQSAWHKAFDIEQDYLSVSSMKDLISLNMAHQLAVEAVASEQLSFHEDFYYAGIPIDNPMGDEMRDCVTKGFMLLFKLQQFYKNLQDRPFDKSNSLIDHAMSFLTGDLAQAQSAEEITLCQQWRHCMGSLANIDLVAFDLMRATVSGRIVYDGRTSSTWCNDNRLWAYVKAKYESDAVAWMMG